MAYLSTSADLLTRTYRFLRESSSSPQRWPSAQVVDYLDEAHACVCADLRVTETQWFTNTSAGVSRYSLPADCMRLGRVLHKQNATSTTYRRLRRASVVEFANYNLNYEASGANTRWYAITGTQGGFAVQLYPTPDASAASGLYYIGSQTPEALATSASPLQRQYLPLIPIYAALLAWREHGVDAEVARLAGIYKDTMARWRSVAVQMSPEENEAATLGDDRDDLPYTTVGRGQPWAYGMDNPLNL